MCRTDRRGTEPRFVWIPFARAVTLTLACTLAGCGEKGPVVQRLHGTVSHAGKPVPRGVIFFDPDVAAGNRGPQGFALIKDGRYDTAAKGGRGTAGGRLVVRIDGSEPVAGAEDSTTADRPLFATHEEHIEVPTGSSTRDFDVPAATR